MCILTPKKCINNYEMRVILNKEHMIHYYQLKYKYTKSRDATKMGRNWLKLPKIEKNLNLLVTKTSTLGDFEHKIQDDCQNT